MATKPKVWAGVGAVIAAVIGGVVAIEGGYVNDPNDSGGATNHGVTEKVARANGYTGSMQTLPQDFAAQVYERQYVYGPHYDLVLAASPALGHKMIDAGVNVGPARASRWLQQAINDLSRGGRDYPRIAVDGAIGPTTMRAYAALEKRRGRIKACELTLRLIDAYQTMHYVGISASSQANASFTVGWIDNRIGNIDAARCSERVAP